MRPRQSSTYTPIKPMNEPAIASNTSGGTEALRGFEFQAYSLVYYTLLRLQMHPSLSIAIESTEDAVIEDAVIEYPADSSTNSPAVTELLQCKKKERGGSNVVRRGYRNDEVELDRF